MEGVIYIGRLLGTAIELLTGEGCGGGSTGDKTHVKKEGQSWQKIVLLPYWQ